jgi:chromosome segregation ATPase
MSEMKEILYRLTEMGQDIKDIKTDVAELKTDVAGLKTDVAGLKTDVAELKTDVAELKTRMGNLESTVDQIRIRQEVIVEQTAGLMEFRTETKSTLEDLQEDQLSISHILGEHEIDIRGLRRRLA